MGTEEANQTPTNWTVCNYAVSFIDLLGQRTKFADQGILPSFASDKEHQQFLTIVKESIGPIFALQRQADAMLRGFLKAQQNSPRRAALPPQLRASFDELQRTRITTQRWSDGLVSFVSLGDQTVKCPMNGIYCLFVLAGSHCLLGLAMQQPLRGAIELAWGVELRDGELYGPVVARAYELETTAAQYPRI
ncbi:MAG TPA: hypothetical protein VMH34_10530, partial [Gammaproteobacteria bacterium]|nr:hypothetical protein [Gammaproteobacteria bacterium]